MLRSLIGMIALATATARAQTPPPANVEVPGTQPPANVEVPGTPPPANVDVSGTQPPPPPPASVDVSGAQPPPPPPANVEAPGAQLPTQPSPGAQPPRPSVMDRRWAIGIDVGPESYRADVDGAQKVEFGHLELAGRYRVQRPIELGLALHLGGSNHIGMGGLYIDARYRFRAEQKLDVYVLASLGALAIAHESASETEKKGRGSLRLGVGGEYRWRRFGLAAELRLIGVGKNKDLAVMPMETVGYQLARAKLSGGSLALGANFYF